LLGVECFKSKDSDVEHNSLSNWQPAQSFKSGLRWSRCAHRTVRVHCRLVLDVAVTENGICTPDEIACMRDAPTCSLGCSDEGSERCSNVVQGTGVKVNAIEEFMTYILVRASGGDFF